MTPAVDLDGDDALAAVAEAHVTAPLGGLLGCVPERVVKQTTLLVPRPGDPLTLHLVWTRGGGGTGRLLVAADPTATTLHGGALVLVHDGAPGVHAVWVAPALRRRAGAVVDVGAVLAAMARDAGVTRALLPASVTSVQGALQPTRLRVVNGCAERGCWCGTDDARTEQVPA